MSIRQVLASALRRVAQLPGIRPLLRHRSIRGRLQMWPGFAAIYGRGWDLLHPFDRAFGTDTSGFVPTNRLPVSLHDKEANHVYAGSQPSILRTALSVLPSLEGYTFIDLGCGKGRPLLVASEFPFQELIGVELSPQLAETARANAAILHRHPPTRPPVRVVTSDASVFCLPRGNLVVFLYNPFGAEVISKVVTQIEAALAAEKRSLYLVYYNPVYGAVVDASPQLKRYFAASLPYAKDEHGFGPDEEDSVVIWQPRDAGKALAGSDARIVVTRPGYRADLSSGET